MGEKGSKRTALAGERARVLAERLSALGPVELRGMFGGYGVFHGGAMFGLVSSDGVAHLRVNASSRRDFETAGSKQHGKMPYYSIPAAVLDDASRLLEWARRAADAARSEKRPAKKARAR